MAALTFAERLRLARYAARRGWARTTRRVRISRWYRWRYMGDGSDRLSIAPQDLRTADPTQSAEIYAGRFAFAGHVVSVSGRSIFEMAGPSAEWTAVLHGFGWLRHLRAADSGITRTHAQALVAEWIQLARWDPVATEPEIVARRVISWITHSPLILADAEPDFYRRFMRSLGAQIRYLRSVWGKARDGVPRLLVGVALAYATLCAVGQERHQKGVARLLSRELDRQILADGGHLSRNPDVLIDLLLDFLPLRQTYASRAVETPPALLNAIDRMMPMMRFFRHGDGTFAAFNGMGPTRPDLLATILAYDDARGRPPSNASHSGYQRLEAGQSVVVADTGKAPPVGVSQDAHAGCLAFEFSSERSRIVVNCGVPAAGRAAWRDLARASAAHSTLVLDDTSSARFADAGRLRELVGTPIIAGPEAVTVTRDEKAMSVTARHDGYGARFGLLHERELVLGADGLVLAGTDRLIADKTARRPAAAKTVAIRFHIHPQVKVSRLDDGHRVLLVPQTGPTWVFAADQPVQIEESVFLSGPHGPRRTDQIVITGAAAEGLEVTWMFEAQV